MLRGLGPQIRQINVAEWIGLDRDHIESRHHRTGWIRPVGGHGDQAGRPVVLTPGAMEGTDHQQAREFALRARIRLQRHFGEAGDLRQLGFELAEEQLVAGGLVPGDERMQPVQLAPADRHHLGGGVQLHGAGAERNHR